MRAVVRTILVVAVSCAAAAVMPACGGGGGEGNREQQGPPPPPFSTTLETGLAIGNGIGDIAIVDGFALVPVVEAEQGIDLNGDGDTLDRVAHLLEIASNTSTNLGLAIRGPVTANRVEFAFLASEGDQNGTDLNGDGDTSDSVWHIFDPAAAPGQDNPLNLAFATTTLGAPGAGIEGGFLLVVSEAAHGADLAGDGDINDDVVIAFGTIGRATTLLAMPPHAPGTPILVRGNRALVLGSELAMNFDFNGDGDATDFVLGAIGFDQSGAPPFYIPVGHGKPRAVVPGGWALTDSFAVYLIDEAGAGNTDLNGDGDTQDGILAVFDLRTASGENMPIDTSIGLAPFAADPLIGIGTSAERVLFGIDENQQGTDINKDQDTSDVILAWVDTANAPSVAHSTGLTLGSTRPLIEGTIGLVTISEAASQLVVGIDYNLDGDISDQVAFRIDTTTAPATLTNLGRATLSTALLGTDAILGVSEAAQSNQDFNGDTDTDDIVPFYADLSRPTPGFASLGTSAHGQVMLRTATEGLRLGLLVPEQPLTSRADVNGDGDSADNALLWVDIDASGTPPRVLSPTPFVIGIAGFSRKAPLPVNDRTLLFETSEIMAQRDLNGDGDADDTVLRIVIRPAPE